MDTVAQAIRQIIADEVGRDPASMDDAATLEALGLDSLDLISVIVSAEDFFGVEIPDQGVEVKLTLGAFVQMVRDAREVVPHG
jgi:acyl carrier protein